MEGMSQYTVGKYYAIFERIRELEEKEFMEFLHKLKLANETRYEIFGELANFNSEVNLEDISQALTYCRFHFVGGLTEDIAEECPCFCRCMSCEVIPKNEISIRMHELAADMKEENVMVEFINEYGEYIKSIQIGDWSTDGK